MAAMQAPIWTSCLLFLWFLIIPATIWTHVSVGKLLPPVHDLQSNVAHGFDHIFQFAILEQESKSIQSSASSALAKCNRNPTTDCSHGWSTYPAGEVEVDTAAEKAQMQDTFSRSLNTVKSVTGDPYFGVANLKHTDMRLSQIIYSMKAISPIMMCNQAVPIYCSIYDSAGEIVNGMDSVHVAMHQFKTCDSVRFWEDHETLLIFLHFLPYILITGLLCFTFFWWRGGVCFWCGGKDRLGNLVIPLYMLCLAAAFVSWLTVAIVGYVMKYDPENIEVKALAGTPNQKVTIQHLRTNFPAFWNLVFKDIADAAELLLPCAWFFFAVTLFIGLYSMCECIMSPYRQPPKAVEEPPKQEEAKPEPEPVPAPPVREEPQETLNEV